jgi:hypothetical protein
MSPAVIGKPRHAAAVGTQQPRALFIWRPPERSCALAWSRGRHGLHRTASVFRRGKGLTRDQELDNGRYKPVTLPHTITVLGVGTHTIYLRAVDQHGNIHPTPAKFTFTVKKDKGGGYPDTWINWVRVSPRGVNVPNGGSTSSSKVTVDFQDTVSGQGSHIDLKIDDGRYKPVASPHILSPGYRKVLTRYI